MALRFEDGWLVGDDGGDLEDFLKERGADGYPIQDIRHSLCRSCGGTAFEVHGVLDERMVKRICGTCAAEQYIGDSETFWDEDSSYVSACVCGAELFNVAVGFSLYAGDVPGVRSLATAERCVACGRVGSLAEWLLRSTDMTLLDRA
jgi:hypothetical protein